MLNPETDRIKKVPFKLKSAYDDYELRSTKSSSYYKAKVSSKSFII